VSIGRVLVATLVEGFVSSATALDEPYVEYLMRRVSEGLAAERAAHVTDRLEGAELTVRYADNLKEEKAPVDFIQKTSAVLWRWLAEENEPWVRHFLVEALAEVDAVQNRLRLRALIKDRDPTVRARAIEHIPPPLTADEETDLLHQLAVEDLWWVKSEILLVLASGTADDSLNALHAALLDPSRDLRAAASVALRSRPDSRNVEPLIEALDNAGLFGSESPVWALGAIKSPAAVEALSRQANSPYAPVRMGAATAMGRMQDERCIPSLSGLLHDPDSMVQEAAAEALAEVGGEEAALQLLSYLSLSPDEKRLQAALRIKQEQLSGACARIMNGSTESSQHSAKLREACELIKAHIADERVVFWSSGDFHSAFYSAFNAKARKVVPQKGRRVIGWEDFIGKEHNGTRHVLRAGTRVTIWKAAYYQGDTWLEVTAGPYDPDVWVREADLQAIASDELLNLPPHTDFGADTRMRIKVDKGNSEDPP